MCRECKRALASGEPRLNPAMCYPATTVDHIKDLPLRVLVARTLMRGHLAAFLARRAAIDELLAEPTTPCSEVVNSLPPEPEVVDENGEEALAEDTDDGWQIIQRVLDGSAWD
jgi:hypothetical protein